jgi:copper homeostasis protein
MNALEIIVETLEDAQAAEAGGATQLDLKAHYPCSGITPSIGMVTVITQQVKIPAIMMIRPHARSFQASAGDLQAAAADIQKGREMGVGDFMFGFLTSEQDLDVKAVEILHKAAGDARIHMHLGWELCRDPWQALQRVLDLGFDSIHTGGLSTQGKAFGGSALDAAGNIRRIAGMVADRMEIFLAGSVSAENAAELMHSTGITNLHCGRGVRTPPTAEGAVDAEKVRRLRQAQLAAISNKS